MQGPEGLRALYDVALISQRPKGFGLIILCGSTKPISSSGDAAMYKACSCKPSGAVVTRGSGLEPKRFA